MKAEISVVVVSWNAKKYVEECLSSLAKQNLRIPVEIIVVDNASFDGTPAMIRERFPEVRLFQNASNLGFAKANNIGIRAACGRYVALINSDVNVPPACLQDLYEFMERNVTVGVAGPRMVGPDGNVGRSYMRFPTVWNCLCTALGMNTLFRRSRLFGGVLMTDFSGDTTADVDVLNGWFLVVRRQALEETGLLDELFFMYAEDIDWSLRFKNAGWRRVYYTGACALHYGGSSSAVVPIKSYIEMHRANIQFWKKHHTRAGVLAYWLTVLIHQLIRLARHSCVWLVDRSSKSDSSFKIRRSTACLAWLMGARPVQR